MTMTYILLFVFYLILDVLYAYYIIALTELKAVKSSLTSAIIMGMSLFGTIEIIKNHWNALPIILGCFCGTYISVRLKKSNERGLAKDSDSEAEEEISVMKASA
ncbi:MAG: hypothetical protein RBU28_02825 [Bacteroidales bacterium]|nr:hypothetical protein [Bacteroidales bacterium]